ncbi:MAG TPA: hypothetical protein VFB62_23485 [Polyangiaceae bacterium]|jgi:pentatricopeptide repeat protein|nr:hypothetical protein [Polyangiaceae bacterium]
MRILLALVLLCACGDNQDPEEAKAMWERIHQENYRGFARAPGYETRQPSNTAHSDQVDIYVNDVLAQAQPGIASWPVGSLIVKDGFTSDGELELVAVMDKRDDGWFWVEYNDVAAGEAKYSGKPDICTGCHESGADFVRAFTFPE